MIWWLTSTKRFARLQIEHFLALVFVVTGCISISAVARLVDIPTRIISSTIELNICAITVRISQIP